MTAAPHYAAFITACLAVAGCGSGDDAARDRRAHQIVPAPVEITLASGEFEIASGTPVAVTADGADARAVADYLIELVGQSRGIHLVHAGGGPPPQSSIRLALLPPAAGADPEGYELAVSADGIDIRASDARGLFYGAVTLWQLITADGAPEGPASIPALQIRDAPRFAWRGLMLDSARHFQSVELIERLIDWMALHKLNVLHWHLTDDQGWRLEIRKYPRLTEIGAWRIPAGDTRRYGGFYTQHDVRRIVRHAAARHVTIIPEIEMPGHAQAAIASYPRLGTGGLTPPVSPDWGVHDWLFNVDESTFAFLEDVLGEVIELFPGRYIHVGGDEAVKDRWKSSPRVQARMKELGIADETALQARFVTRIEQYLDGHGRRLIGWDEILDGGIPARATAMSWRGTAGAVAAVRGGHDVVMSPAPGLYLDHLQSDSPREPPGRPKTVTLADIYAFEPVPAELAPDEAPHILGAQVNAWTEHMRTPDRLIHQIFPRAAALAEVTWSPRGRRDWNDFLGRMPAQFARYRRLGLAAADTAFEPRTRVTRAGGAERYRIELTNQVSRGAFHYTLDGSEPGAASPAYESALELDPGAVLRAATFLNGLPLSAAITVTVGEELLRRRHDEDLGQCTGNLLLRLEDDAPPEGPRAYYNVDIVDPCWILRGADLSRGPAIRAAVGQLPFNFQIGKDADAIRRGDARTAAGELEVRLGGCDRPPVAVLPLAPAAAATGVTELPPVRLPPLAGRHDLCLRFARPAIDPIWAVQWVELGESP